jgi:decaprenyl-diphosphate synthase subunit 1
MVTEMIHTATLVHDDIIDGADVRRGKPSINSQWGEKKAVLTGNYILAEASRVLASIDNAQVIDLLANVLEDLVRGPSHWHYILYYSDLFNGILWLNR